MNQFEKELLAVQDELFRFAYKLTANREKAEDLLQDTLLQGNASQRKLQQEHEFQRVAVYHHAQHAYQRLPGGGRSYPPVHILRSCILFADHGRVRREEVDKNYDLEKIRNAIKSVPESHFIPFEMYLSGFKYREIAERTGVSLGTIKSRIFHCRKKLKAILAE